MDESFEQGIEKLRNEFAQIAQVVNNQADIFQAGIEINEEIVSNIQDEINMMWSVLELPWYKRIRRLNRSWAVAKLGEINAR